MKKPRCVRRWMIGPCLDKGDPLFAGLVDPNHAIWREFRRWRGFVPRKGEKHPMDSLAQAFDFADAEDFYECVSAVSLSTPERRVAFLRWQHFNGEKAGLLRLPRKRLRRGG